MEVGNQVSKNLKKKQWEPVPGPKKMMIMMVSDMEGAAPLKVEGGAKSGQWWEQCVQLPLLKD